MQYGEGYLPEKEKEKEGNEKRNKKKERKKILATKEGQGSIGQHGI